MLDIKLNGIYKKETTTTFQMEYWNRIRCGVSVQWHQA